MLNGSLAAVKAAFLRVLFWLISPQMAYFVGEPFFWLLGLRRNAKKVDFFKAKRVLVVRVDEIGDVVLSTPFLRELRRNLPDAWITLVVKPSAHNLVELCPYVNEVLTYEWKTLLTDEQKLKDWVMLMLRHMRALELALFHFWHRRFDLAILPRWDTDHYNATFLAYFSGAHWRVGYSEKVNDHKRRFNSGYERLLTHVLSNNRLKHEVERNLDILRFLGGMVKEEWLELWISPEDETFEEQVLSPHGGRLEDLLVAIGFGAREPKRMWPITNFVELGIWLKREYDSRILVVGEKREQPLGQELKRQIGDAVINIAGRATLRQTVALLRRCQLCVSNDAAPMHMAAVAGVTVIEISCHPKNGSMLHVNSPKRFGPRGVPHIVLQPETALPPCSDGCNYGRAHCILGVTVEEVKRAFVALLSDQDGRVVTGRVRQHAS